MSGTMGKARLVRFDLRRLSEKPRRLVTIGAGLLLLAGICWVATQAVAEAGTDRRREMWIRFTIAALVIAIPWSVFVWRKLADPNFADWKIDPSRYFFLLVGLGILFRRQFFDTPAAVVLLTGASTGYVAATIAIYLYDLSTNALSQGRSWHYPHDHDQRLDHSSNTRSPT